MNVEKEKRNEQLIKTHPIDEFKVIQLVNIENKGWQICFKNSVISPETFETIKEAEDHIEHNLVKLLIPIITLCIEKYNDFYHERNKKFE